VTFAGFCFNIAIVSLEWATETVSLFRRVGNAPFCFSMTLQILWLEKGRHLRAGPTSIAAHIEPIIHPKRASLTK
jgi:hypothetical protein